MTDWLVFPAAASLGLCFGVLGGRDLAATAARIAGGGGSGSALWGLARRMGIMAVALFIAARWGPTACLCAGLCYVAGVFFVALRRARANGS